MSCHPLTGILVHSCHLFEAVNCLCCLYIPVTQEIFHHFFPQKQLNCHTTGTTITGKTSSFTLQPRRLRVSNFFTSVSGISDA